MEFILDKNTALPIRIVLVKRARSARQSLFGVVLRRILQGKWILGFADQTHSLQISALGSSQYDRFWSFWSCGFVEACGINSGAAPHHQVPKPLAPDKSPGRIQGLRFRVY